MTIVKNIILWAILRVVHPLEKQGYLFAAIEKIYFMKMIQMMQIQKNTILCHGKLQIIAPILRNTCQNL